MNYLKSVWILFVIMVSIGQGAPEADWTAQWIGTATEPGRDLSGAAWIWTQEAEIDPLRNAPAGARYFRRTVELTGGAPVVAATVFMAADNRFVLLVNGQEAGRGDSWDRPQSIDIARLLKQGRNMIAVRAENDPAAGSINAAGLIGKVTILRAGQAPVICVTDGSWRSAVTAPADWAAPAYSGGEWPAARVLGEASVAPWRVVADATTAQPNQWTCFRKQFNLDKPVQSATARIAVDSKYWLWVNGQLVVYEGGLKRGPNPKDTYFDSVDLTRHLHKGSNTLAILAWYWGKDGYSHKSSGKAGLVAELELDGRRIGTGGDWKAIRHPAYGTTGDPHPNYRMPDDNIHFDGRADLDDWTGTAYDDGAWPGAITLGVPPCEPWNYLVERPTPLWRIGDLSRYENDTELPKVSDGKPIIARLPRNLTISPYLKIKAPAGLTIDLRTDNYKGGSEYNYRSEYITREGIQEFESLAYLNGHWMIYSIPAGVEILELRYRETRYDTDFVGRFECDDPFLNTLWIKCRNTMNVNMRDAIQDPDRERAQWWGDAVIVMGEIFHACDTRGQALARKAIYNLVDWQKPDGVLYSPVPAGSWDRELPGQMLASIGMHGFWYYYLYSGDKETLVHAYPAVKRYLALWKLGPDGLVVHRTGGWDWGDWGENIDRPVLDNALFYQALESAINMAQVTGHEGDIPGYRAMMASIAANFNRVLWTGSEYRSPGHKGVTDDRGQGLAVLAGLAQPEQWPAIKAVFTRSFQASPYMEKYILESLLQMGDTEAALTRMKSRYRKMVESDLSTLWEGWGVGSEGYGGGSYNHGWSGGPLTLMMQMIAGVAPTTPGFGTYQVMPQMGPLRDIVATVPSVKGAIEVEMHQKPEQFTLSLTSPPATVARVGIPCGAGGAAREVSVNGRPAGECTGVRFVERTDKYLIYEVEPGRWEFVALN